MKAPALPYNEQERLQELYRLNILDTDAESDFDELTALASAICEVPISLVSLVDKDRQWFKSKVGLAADETPRDVSFCGHATLTPDQAFVIRDARNDERFADNPLVVSTPNVIFYAGMPIVTSSGNSLGTLCVIDHTPRHLTDRQLMVLKTLAGQVGKLFELRERQITIETERNFYHRKSVISDNAKRLAKVGSWEELSPSGAVFWSAITCSEIMEVERDFKPKQDSLFQFCATAKSRMLLKNAFEKLRACHQAFDIEVPIITGKGNEKWVRVIATVETDRNPIRRYYGAIQDISEQVMLRQQLEASQEQLFQESRFYKSLVDNESFFIVKLDKEGRFTFLNQYYINRFRVNPEGLLGKPALNSILPHERERWIAVFDQCLNQPNTNHRILLSKEAQEGQLITNQWDFKGLTSSDGELKEVLCIGYEVTALLNQQKQLETLVHVTAEQNKRLLNFTYITSHNIRSHVANLKGLSTLVNNGQLENSTALSLMKRTIEALDETIHQLNEVISIQNNVNLPMKNLTLRDEVAKILNTLQLAIAESGADVRMEFPETIKIVANPAYMESILLNLISNAINYRKPETPPEIIVSFEKRDTFNVVSVRDNGLGLDLLKNRDKVFGMYKTFHGNKDAKGLGLFIIKAQIEAMRGKIDVVSEPGAGAQFNVYFHAENKPDISG